MHIPRHDDQQHDQQHDPPSEQHRWWAGSDRRRLVRAAARLLGPADAEDAVQDAYVRALEARRPALNAAQAWLLTVVRHRAIDQLRRRHWMAQWLQHTAADALAAPAAPSAEADAALRQEVEHALQWLAASVSATDAAALLLHAVFDASHAQIAQASGRSEDSSRQQLRRTLMRLRQSDAPPRGRSVSKTDTNEEAVFRVLLQSLQARDPQALWATLRQAPTRASTTPMAAVTAAINSASMPPQRTTCSVVQAAGQLGLVLSLDGVTLCVLPLGVRPAQDAVVAENRETCDRD